MKSRLVGETELPVEELIPHPENWRVHGEVQRRALSELLERVGWVERVVVNRRTGRIVDGHLRAELSAAAGETTVPVQLIDVDEDEERLLLASLDPIAAMAQTGVAELRSLLERTGDLLDEFPEASGVLRDLLARTPEGYRERAAPRAPTVPAEAGAVYAIGSGSHLVVADSLDPATWERVTGLIGGSPEAFVADPPYELDAADLCRVLELSGAERGVALVGLGAQLMAPIRGGWDLKHEWVWLHGARWSPSSTRPVIRHTPVLVLARPGSQLGWRRPDPKFSSVIEVPYDPVAGHGHAKRPELFMELMRGFRWTRWVDPFAGTGPSIVAAEALGRRIVAVEKDPQTAGLALQRAGAAGLRVRRASAARRSGSRRAPRSRDGVRSGARSPA